MPRRQGPGKNIFTFIDFLFVITKYGG